MEDLNTSASSAEDRIGVLSFLGGLLIALACFLLLFTVLARFIPVFIRFADSPQAKFIPVISILFIMLSGSLGYSFRRRAKRLRSARDGRRLHQRTLP